MPVHGLDLVQSRAMPLCLSRVAGSLLTLAFALAPAADLAAQGGAAPLGRYKDQVFAQHTVHSDLIYGQAINRTSQQLETLRLDLYEPTGDTELERPAVVIAHGGSFIFGDRAASEYVQLGTDFAKRGYVAVSISYRKGFPPLQGVRDDASLDMKAAVRWLRANAAQWRIDTDRIAVLGASAGGFMALSVAYSSLGEGSSGSPGFSSEPQAVVDLWGALEDIDGMQAGDVPVQIIHGTNDPVVPYALGLAVKARADAVGVYAELFPISGAGHSPWSQYFQNYHPEVVGFLYEQLRMGKRAGLVVNPGFGSPGTISVDTFGVGGRFYALAVAPQSLPTPIPGIGEASIGPATSILLLQQGLLPASPRLSSATANLPVPGGLSGLLLHWQVVQLGGAGALFTNTAQTTF